MNILLTVTLTTLIVGLSEASLGDILNIVNNLPNPNCQKSLPTLPDLVPNPAIPPASGQPAYCSDTGGPNLAICPKRGLEDMKNKCRTQLFPARLPVAPSWINCTLYQQGQQVFSKYFGYVITGQSFGFTTSAFPDLSELLYFAGLGFDATLNEKRIFSTLSQLMMYQQDTTICPKWASSTNISNTIRGLGRVYKVHNESNNAAVQQLSQTGWIMDPNYQLPPLVTALSGPFLADLTASPIPMSQRGPSPANWKNNTATPFIPSNQQSAAVVQYAMLSYFTLFPERLNCTVTNDEIWAFSHMWAVISAMSGVTDECNISLQPDLATLKSEYLAFFNQFTIPNLFQQTPLSNAFNEIVATAIQSMTSYVMSPNLILYRFLTTILNIDAPNTLATLTVKDIATNITLGVQQVPVVGNSYALGTGLNLAFSTLLQTTGYELFGLNYTNFCTRSEYAFFAKYGVEDLTG